MGTGVEVTIAGAVVTMMIILIMIILKGAF